MLMLSGRSLEPQHVSQPRPVHSGALIVVFEVLDALVNHLEETLEAVLSRGENLVLDNKVRTPASDT